MVRSDRHWPVETWQTILSLYQKIEGERGRRIHVLFDHVMGNLSCHYRAVHTVQYSNGRIGKRIVTNPVDDSTRRALMEAVYDGRLFAQVRKSLRKGEGETGDGIMVLLFA